MRHACTARRRVSSAAHAAVVATARQGYGRLVALLAARTRDIAAAEDALADAFERALSSWPQSGVPACPEAWLLTIARRRLIDAARQARVRLDAQPLIELDLRLERALAEDAAQTDMFPDERLKLMFVCAHPAIDAGARTPLMLQTVLGLDAVAIASAFLVAPAAMGQRLVRAKNKIREAGIAFEVPEPAQWPERLQAVLDAIYAAYGSGWEAAGTGAVAEAGLAREALELARLLVQLLPHEPEALGLLALVLHCESRRPARRGEGAVYVPLSEQDPRLWSAAMIAEAEAVLTRAGALRRPGRYQLEAAIQSVHAQRAHTGRVEWGVIAMLYAGLVQHWPSIGARVGQAAAVAQAEGAEAGLARLEMLAGADVDHYQPYWAVRAHVLAMQHRNGEARAAYQQALALTRDGSVRDFLAARCAALSG